MTIQQLVDKLTNLCHHGLAQAEVKLMGESLVHNVTGVEKIDDDTVLIRWSEEVLRKELKDVSIAWEYTAEATEEIKKQLTKVEQEIMAGHYCMRNTCMGCSLYVECGELQDKIKALRSSVARKHNLKREEKL